jgi:uncharacterized protein YlzI (FlbEa/FlbD family)
MNKLIRLTKENDHETVLVNIDFIVTVEKNFSDNGSSDVTMSNGAVYNVAETVQEIYKEIEFITTIKNK